MRIMLNIVFIPVYVLMLSQTAHAQGCSDAGFCTIGNLNQHRVDSTERGQKITLLLPIGIGDEDVFVFTPGIQYENKFSPYWSIQAKLTANYANGNLGSAYDLGDLFLSGTHTRIGNRKWNTSITLGTKLPLNLGNLMADGKALPMQYQSSLGTIDLITGFSVTNNTWQFSAGWQQPLSGINRNNFLPIYWNTPDAENYPPSNDFNRKGDVLLRVGYAVKVNQNFRLIPDYSASIIFRRTLTLTAISAISRLLLKVRKALPLTQPWRLCGLLIVN